MFAIGGVKRCSKHVSSVVAAAKYCSLTPCRFHPFSKHPTNGRGRGVWPPFIEIDLFRPLPPFFCHCPPFPEGPKSTWEIEKKQAKGLFPQIQTWRVAGRESGSPELLGSPRTSPEVPPNFPGSFSATSPEVLSLWNLTAIQRFPRSSPNFPGSSPNFPEVLDFPEVPDFPGGQPRSLGSLTPSPDSPNLSLIFLTYPRICLSPHLSFS